MVFENAIIFSANQLTFQVAETPSQAFEMYSRSVPRGERYCRDGSVNRQPGRIMCTPTCSQ